MANLFKLSKKINSFKSLKKVTKTMNTVASIKLQVEQSKLSSSRLAVRSSDNCLEKISQSENGADIVNSIFGLFDDSSSGGSAQIMNQSTRAIKSSGADSKTGGKTRQLVLIYGPERGLCGALPTNILRQINLQFSALLHDQYGQGDQSNRNNQSSQGDQSDQSSQNDRSDRSNQDGQSDQSGQSDDQTENIGIFIGNKLARSTEGKLVREKSAPLLEKLNYLWQHKLSQMSLDGSADLQRSLGSTPDTLSGISPGTSLEKSPSASPYASPNSSLDQSVSAPVDSAPDEHPNVGLDPSSKHKSSLKSGTHLRSSYTLRDFLHNVEDLAAIITALVCSKALDRVCAIYPLYHNVIKQQIVIENIFPFKSSRQPRAENTKFEMIKDTEEVVNKDPKKENISEIKSSNVSPTKKGPDLSCTEFDDCSPEAVQRILEVHCLVKLTQIWHESATSEQGARSTAMSSATENIEERVSSLSLEFNKKRQEIITNELSEIIAGSEAV